MRSTFKLLDSPDFPSNRSIGFSVQRFPRYVNAAKDFHQHDVVEIFFVLQGYGLHFTKEGESELKPGSMSVIHYGQEHCILTKVGAMDIINIYVDTNRCQLPALPTPLGPYLPRILPLAPDLGHKLNEVIQYQLPEGSPVSDILLRLNHEMLAQHPGYLEVMKIYFQMFLIECARYAYSQNEHLHISSGSHLAIERVRRKLDVNWKEFKDLEELARQSRMSKPHLCRMFKKYTGKTILEYVHQRRVEHAMIMLDSTSEKVINISHEAGFSDLAHFNRIFKRLAGMSPSEFRNRLKNSDT